MKKASSNVIVLKGYRLSNRIACTRRTLPFDVLRDDISNRRKKVAIMWLISTWIYTKPLITNIDQVYLKDLNRLENIFLYTGTSGSFKKV